MASVGTGFARGFTAGATLKQNKRAREDEQAEAKQKAFQDSIDNARTASLENFQQILEFSQQAAQSGAGEQDLEQMRRGAQAALAGFGSLLDEIKARAIASGGTQDDLANIPSGESFVAQHMNVFDQGVFAGVTENPVNTGIGESNKEFAGLAQMAENLRRSGINVSDQQLLQAAGVTPAPNIREGLVDGQPSFVNVTAEGATPIPGAGPIPSGLSLSVNPDGTIQLKSGDQLPAATTTTQTKIEKSILDSQEGLARLQSIQQTFDPNFLTFAGKIKGGITALKEKLGADIKPEEEEFLARYSEFTQNSISNLNLYIKEITGAQMSEFEADRLRKGIPDPENDSPTQFKSKLDTSLRSLILARARAIHARKQGVDATPWEITNLGDMEEIINKRAAELTKELGDRQAAIDQVAKEFGL